MYSQLVN